MPLAPSALATSLRSGWLAQEGGSGSYPSSPAQSGDRFAAAVAGWFGAAVAGTFPCTTATARQGQLSASATAALQAGLPPAAGLQLAMALAGYMTGQVFGPGLASAPTATGAAQAAIADVFSNLDLPVGVRADRIASGVHTLALSTIVVFPPVVAPPTPVS